MRPRSLRGIAILYVVLILIGLVAARMADYTIAHWALNSDVDRRLEREVVEITQAAPHPTLTQMIATIERERDEHDSADLFFALFDSAGRRIGGSLGIDRPPPPGYFDFDARAGIRGVDHGRGLTRRLADGATLVVVSDNDVIDRFDRMTLRSQLIGFAIAIIIVAGGAGLMVREIGRRLRAMQRTAEAVINGDFGSRVPQGDGTSEFDRQAAAFNAMLDRIETLMNDIRHAANDVAHELKSPLARLRTRIAAIERHATGNPLAPEIAEIVADADQLLDLFASLMRLWEIEGGHRRERFVSLDLAALAREAGEVLTPIAEDAGQSVTVVASTPVPLLGERNLLRQLLVNLVENAIRHTPAGASIELRTEIRDNRARLIVSDDGPGIPAEHHDSVIRRFGRLKTDEDVPGHGIGLTLVDAIARLHRGTLTLEDGRPGLRAIVDLPGRA